MPEGFPFVDIGNMNFYHRDIQQQQGIFYGHTGVGVGCRVDDHTTAYAGCLLNFINQRPFVVGLECFHL